jgi:hypothetical protein
MQPQQPGNNPSGAAGDSGTIACSQCGAPMPPEMRFCRACGNRLGEGPAEYTETVRFPNANATGQRSGSGFAPPYAAPIAQQTGAGFPYKRRRRLSGMAWVFIIIAIFFVMGAGLSALRKNVRSRPGISINFNRTYFGVDGFDDAPGGVTFDVVEPPGGPADKAGLVGGDIVTSFDGHAVTNQNEMKDLLRSTPAGKTVEVIYLRDGEIKKTQLTTISPSDFGDLERAFRIRPEGRGYFGFESNRTTKIADPQTKIYGVRLDYVERNGPSDLFGLKEGDIITSFDDVPIRTGDELLARVRRAIPRSTIIVTLIRGGQTIKIPVTMGRA